MRQITTNSPAHEASERRARYRLTRPRHAAIRLSTSSPGPSLTMHRNPSTRRYSLPRYAGHNIRQLYTRLGQIGLSGLRVHQRAIVRTGRRLSLLPSLGLPPVAIRTPRAPLHWHGQHMSDPPPNSQANAPLDSTRPDPLASDESKLTPCRKAAPDPGNMRECLAARKRRPAPTQTLQERSEQISSTSLARQEPTGPNQGRIPARD